MAGPKYTSKQEKQKMVISRGGGSGEGGGNVGGVIVWGGVFAIATLVSVISAIKLRNKRQPTKTNHRQPPQQPPDPSSTTDACNQLEVNDNSSDSDQGKGLLVLQDNSSPPLDYNPRFELNKYISGDGIKDLSPIQIDPTSMDSNKSLISDIDTMLEITQPKEKPSFLDILLGDKPKPENRPLETDHGFNKQDYSLVVEEKAVEDKMLQADQFEELPKKESMGKGGEEEEQENGAKTVTEVTDSLQIAVLFNQEVLEVRKEDGAVKAPDAPQIEAEDDMKKMQLIGKGEEGQQGDGENTADTYRRATDRTQEDQFVVEFNLEEIQVMKDHPLMQLVRKEQENGESIVETVEAVVKTGQKDQLMIELDPEAIQVMEEEKATDSSRIEAKDNSEIQLIGEEREHEHGENDEAVGTIEDNPLLRLSDEEEEGDEVDEDEDGEEIAEKGEESSEETGGSSMESNAEAIWPMESIEELSLQQQEESKTNIHKLEDNIDQYRTVETEESGCYASIHKAGIHASGNYKNEETEKSRISPMNELLMRIRVSMDTSNMGFWILSAAVLLLIVVAPLLLPFANIVKLSHCLLTSDDSLPHLGTTIVTLSTYK